ncbi:MAG: hypothetical protein GY720_16710 [bacterium]|nr:hypothetical protein [bacterium]
MQISKSRVGQIAPWVAVGLLAAWLLALTVIVTGELRAIDAVLAEGAPSLAELGIDAGDIVEVGEPVSMAETRPQVGIAGARALSGTLAMTVTVRASGPGDLLYEAPQVMAESGRAYPITGASLAEARLAFLDLVTGGQATAQLTFTGAPALDGGDGLTLVFNPNRTPVDAYIAPRIEVPIPLEQ